MAEEASILGAPTETAPTDAPAGETATPILGGEKPPESTADNPETKKSDEPTKTEAKPEVPEKYEFKVPEGMTLDEAALAQFEPLAKELGLPQEQAQKLVDLYAAQKQADAKALADSWTKQQQTWNQEMAADKEFGGQNFNTTKNQANAVLAKFSTPEEVKAIEAMGLGSYPPFVKALARMGKAMGEDSFVKGSTTTAPKAPEDILYGK